MASLAGGVRVGDGVADRHAPEIGQFVENGMHGVGEGIGSRRAEGDTAGDVAFGAERHNGFAVAGSQPRRGRRFGGETVARAEVVADNQAAAFDGLVEAAGQLPRLALLRVPPDPTVGVDQRRDMVVVAGEKDDAGAVVFDDGARLAQEQVEHVGEIEGRVDRQGELLDDGGMFQLLPAGGHLALVDDGRAAPGAGCGGQLGVLCQEGVSVGGADRKEAHNPALYDHRRQKYRAGPPASGEDARRIFAAGPGDGGRCSEDQVHRVVRVVTQQEILEAAGAGAVDAGLGPEHADVAFKKEAGRDLGFQ